MKPTGVQQGSDTNQTGVLFEANRQRRHVPNREVARQAAWTAWLRLFGPGRMGFAALESEYLNVLRGWLSFPFPASRGQGAEVEEVLERYRVSKSTLYRWTRQRPRQSFRTRTSWGEQQGERSQRTRYKYAVVVRNLWLLMRERHRPRTVAEAAGLLSRPGVDVRTLYRAINHWGLGCGRWAEAPSDHQARVLMDVIREGPGEGVPLPRWAPGRVRPAKRAVA